MGSKFVYNKKENEYVFEKYIEKYSKENENYSYNL